MIGQFIEQCLWSTDFQEGPIGGSLKLRVGQNLGPVGLGEVWKFGQGTLASILSRLFCGEKQCRYSSFIRHKVGIWRVCV